MDDQIVTVAAVQLTSGSDREANVERAISLIERACDEGATYIQLPEYFNYYGPMRNYPAVVEPIPGPTTLRLSELAKKRRVTIHVGSMLERDPTSDKCFNTSVLINPIGDVVATYRKVHLFDVEVPGDVAYLESRAIVPGQAIVVAPLPWCNLGMTICFDLRFPALYRELALRGATVVAIPSAFNANTGRAHWEILVRARAIENHVFVIAAAQVGTTAEGLSSYGHSMIVGPWGEVLRESPLDAEDVLVATIDIGEVTRRRSQIAVLALQRGDLYGLRADTDE
jgi:predicted amidohydrolase